MFLIAGDGNRMYRELDASRFESGLLAKTSARRPSNSDVPGPSVLQRADLPKIVELISYYNAF